MNIIFTFFFFFFFFLFLFLAFIADASGAAWCKFKLAGEDCALPPLLRFLLQVAMYMQLPIAKKPHRQHQHSAQLTEQERAFFHREAEAHTEQVLLVSSSPNWPFERSRLKKKAVQDREIGARQASVPALGWLRLRNCVDVEAR